MLLSILIPAYNEAKTIKRLVDYIQSIHYPIPHELLIVDDASTDTDRDLKKELLQSESLHGGTVRIIKNRINRGKGYSIRRGIRKVRGDIVIIQDADYEYDPQDIPKLIQPIIQGECDVVYGSRFLFAKRPKDMAFLNWIANIFLTRMTNWLFGLNLTDMETCHKAFRAELLKSLPLRTNRFTFEPEVTALLAKNGIRIKELPIHYQGRSSKEGKKIKWQDFFSAVFLLLWLRIKCSLSDKHSRI